TSFSRDWSSDVCSSDLLWLVGPFPELGPLIVPKVGLRLERLHPHAGKVSSPPQDRERRDGGGSDRIFHRPSLLSGGRSGDGPVEIGRASGREGRGVLVV